MQECSYEDAMGLVLALLAGAYTQEKEEDDNET